MNTVVIPQNWKTLSRRFDIEHQTFSQQRLKIIGEIIEFHEATEAYRMDPCEENREAIRLELADIVISCATLYRLLGRDFSIIHVNGLETPEEWIHGIVSKNLGTVLCSVVRTGEKMGINVEAAVSKKLAYNRTRKDWK